jgi:hypothetical protein
LVGLGLAILASATQGESFDGVRADRLLSDQDFFAMATCGATPGGTCRGPTVRWHHPEITVALLPGATPDERTTAARVDPVLDRAIAKINATGSGLTLRRTAGHKAHIRVRPTDIPEGSVLADTPGISVAGIMGVGYVSLWWSAPNEISEASILLSTSISDADLSSVVLEELFQSLGPRFDIEGPAYEGVSILSQTSNATLAIVGQDAALLKWLYPPQP